MSTNINTVEEREQWSLMKDQAQVLIQSGALPVAIKNAPQAIAIMQYGRELGLPPMTAFQNISLIQGKPTLSANLIGARLKQAGYDFKVVKYAEDEVTLKFFYKDGSDVDISYTLEEAKKAGNTGKQNYSKYTSEMLYARCLTRGGRIIAPEALAGIYAPEEMSEEVKQVEREVLEVKDITEPVLPQAEEAEVRDVVSDKPEVNEAMKFTKEVAKEPVDVVLDTLDATKTKEVFKKINGENIKLIETLTGERKKRYDKIVSDKVKEWGNKEKEELDNSEMVEAVFKEPELRDEESIEPDVSKLLEEATTRLKGIKDMREYYEYKIRFNFKPLNIIKNEKQIQDLFAQLDERYPVKAEEPKIEETQSKTEVKKEEVKPKGKVRRI